MTQEEKQLLLKDLCARQPYGVKFKAENEDSPIELHYVRDEDVYGRIYSNLPYWVVIIKPYLRSMSSMTEEETLEFVKTTIKTPDGYPMWSTDSYDWLNAHYFDYRGLIVKRLALEAPEGMYE
jgi:hypothetical protein